MLFPKNLAPSRSENALRDRDWLWPAKYNSNGEVVKVYIPYTVKTGGWFSGLGKDGFNMLAFNTLLNKSC